MPGMRWPVDVRRLALLAALTAAAVAMAAPAAAPAAAPVAVGQPLRDLPMRGLNGPDRSLSRYRGQPLLINVWASWCGPCREEMGSLERLAWSGQVPGLVIIGISTDDYESKAKAFLARSNATLTHYIDTRLALEKMLGADRLPLTVLVSPDGTVLGRVTGAREWDGDEAVRWIRDTLKKSR